MRATAMPRPPGRPLARAGGSSCDVEVLDRASAGSRRRAQLAGWGGVTPLTARGAQHDLALDPLAVAHERQP